ncbi:alpha/beta fold hydrolase [Methanobrevibacter filiformis]|uniref:2-succinyl-6-hydroxy-2, 4-cyclohexadiene-1-carboxylate synthase n=1 Tax=Methanobrevibacter filiformis TaxID=55758 RepID=A0A166FD27_9EURY|nr:alpha/beta hydrolase [Methanobrevibacter filiformis]KZX17553.1 2-succinyl-6-hydroxy-2,4-cyclohexadiene-1-carboxylate synthase [Methanobrevibacter filiformis]
MEHISFKEINNKKIETIVFIHTNLVNSWIWKNQQNVFDNYNQIYINLHENTENMKNSNFSIKKTSANIKKLIKNKIKDQKIHFVGIGLGGQIILYILATYPELVKTAIVSGVNVKTSKYSKEYDELTAILENKKIEQLLIAIKTTSEEILSKKSSKFLTSAYLAEYGLHKKEHLKDITHSLNEINEDKMINITKESLKFKIPELKNPSETDKKDVLVLYGTKEYPKVAKSAKIIKKHLKNVQIYTSYRSIHLWNLIEYVKFNTIVKEFIKDKKINLENKPYLKKIE